MSDTSTSAPKTKPVRVSPARSVAFDLLRAVLRKGTPLDEALKAHRGFGLLPVSDRGFARLLAAVTLRRLGQIDRILAGRVTKPLPARASAVWDALRLGVAQICFVETKPHAAVDTTVDLVRARGHDSYAGLTNAVLRGLVRDNADLGAPEDNLPDWLRASWRAAYGTETTAAIAAALMREPTLDLTVRDDPTAVAASLGGTVLMAESVRVPLTGNIPDLPGYDDGAWWVQDAAAALPVRLLGDLAGRRVIDLCAAPGGKTAQLCQSEAEVLAIDRAAKRLTRLRENLTRLGLSAATEVADATTWRPMAPVDAVLLDAPCSATGTIRRHPDILHLKAPGDIARLVDLQTRLLANAAEMVKPGGQLMYCTCSLQPEEGEARVAAFLAERPDWRRAPIAAGEIAGGGAWLTADGDLRTLPSHLPDAGGLDGFYAARLTRRAAAVGGGAPLKRARIPVND